MDHSALWSAFLPDCGLFQSVSCRETDGGSQSLTVLLCRVNNRPLSHAMCLQQCTSFPVSGDSSTVREEVSKETHLMDIVCVCPCTQHCSSFSLQQISHCDAQRSLAKWRILGRWIMKWINEKAAGWVPCILQMLSVWRQSSGSQGKINEYR